MNTKEAYLKAPQVIFRPGPEYGVGTRAFQGISSLACGREGRLWAVWYGGITPGEDHNNYVILAVGTDHGATWSNEKVVIDPDGEGPVRAFDPEIWLAPDGRLWLFWSQQPSDNRMGSLSGVWAITATEAEGPEAAWSSPRRLCDGVMMCKPVLLSGGDWALPVSFWHRRESGSAGMVVSEDRGATWAERGAVDVPPEHRNHDEHMLVERRDGTLWMLVRTLYGIGESVSADRGRRWSALTPSSIPHVCSRFFIRRLQSGRLLLVRHNPGEGRFASGDIRGVRSHLTAYLSEDEGVTWNGGLMLDERVSVSYPDGDQAADGAIYIAYDHDRKGAREIFLAAFREDDVLRGATDSKTLRLRGLINKATRSD